MSTTNYYQTIRKDIDMHAMYHEAKNLCFFPIPLKGGKFPLGDYKEPHENKKGEACGKTFEQVKREVKQCVENREPHNIGIQIERSGLLVFDLDVDETKKLNGVEDFNDFLCTYETDKDQEPPLLVTAGTPSGGQHIYFKSNPRVAHIGRRVDGLKSLGFDKIDVFTQGVLVYPGSVYPGCQGKWESNGTKKHKCGAQSDEDCLFRGKKYEWIKAPEEVEGGIPDIPEWMEEKLLKLFPVQPKPAAAPRVAATAADAKGCNEDEDSDIYLLLDRLPPQRWSDYETWKRLVFIMKSEGCTDEQIHEYSQRCEEKYDAEAVDNLIDSYDPDSTTPVGKGTLHRYLKEDLSPEEYNKLTQDAPRPRLIVTVNARQQAADWKTMQRGDIGLAHIFYERYAKDNVRTVDARGNGYEWIEADRVWKRQDPIYLRNKIGKVLEPIVRVIWNLKVEDVASAKNKEDEKKRKAALMEVTGILKRVQNSKPTQGILEKLLSHTRDETFVTKLDNHHPHLLPIKGGKVVNLKTLEVRDRTREDFFSFELEVDFRRDDAYPNARKFFTEIANKDESLVAYLQQFLGYCLTAETSERSLFICWGEGCNGKSTVIDLMKKIQQKMYCAIDEKVLIKQERTGGATPELIPLMTARLAVFAESAKQEKLNASRVKSLTGNDDISARALYQDQVTFRPSAKVVMLTNHKPEFDITDTAMTDRLKLIPFLARFEQTRENKEYVGRVVTEHLDEMFSWFVEGAALWYKADSLPECTAMSAAMDEYLSELDVVQQFVTENCEPAEGLTDMVRRTPPAQAYQSFVAWCKMGGVKDFKNNKDFVAGLKRLDIVKKKSSGKAYYPFKVLDDDGRLL